MSDVTSEMVRTEMVRSEMETGVSGKILYNFAIMSICVATRMIRAFSFIAYDFWDKDGTFFVNRV